MKSSWHAHGQQHVLDHGQHRGRVLRGGVRERVLDRGGGLPRGAAGRDPVRRVPPDPAAPERALPGAADEGPAVVRGHQHHEHRQEGPGAQDAGRGGVQHPPAELRGRRAQLCRGLPGVR